jgi:Arylsulfotransferase (ASST)
MKPHERRNFLLPGLFLLGLVLLSYLLGAAVMFFQLPTSGILQKAFQGGRSLSDQGSAASPTKGAKGPRVTGIILDKPEKTFDGFTLYTAAAHGSTENTTAYLLNMRGDVVHQWAIPFSRLWPNPPHVHGSVNDLMVSFVGFYLLPNGDLLAVFHGLQNAGKGYGLAKLDKDSHVLWKYAANVHHDVDVAEDGSIYAIQHELVDELPKGLEKLSVPTLVDFLVVLSSEGKVLKKPMPILDALVNSPYSPLLASLATPFTKEVHTASAMERLLEDVRRTDLLHTNCVRVLKRDLAPVFPLFKPGHVLISMRHMDTIAMMDPEKGSVVWAARGPWRGQHDPQFLANGHLLIFDNLGSPNGSRVLEYDPGTQAFPWSYAAENSPPFLSTERGMNQRLPNGNTFIVNSEGGELMEVTPDREVVWSFTCTGFINAARRYSPAALPFLKKGSGPRP